MGFNVSYWLSSTKDELSSMNLSGAAAKPLAGENDLAQNPFDVGAEYGPSLFDARHRFVASASWGPRVPDGAHPTVRAIFGGWQLNGIATFNSGTPFTVSDSANVSLQANSPPISGFAAARPNLVGDPDAGPHTVDEWMSRSAFQRLNPVTQAGQFGNAGRNIARGPGYADLDVSLVRNFELGGDDAARVAHRIVQRDQPRELRPAGGRPELRQLRPDPLCRSAAADAVRRQADLLTAWHEHWSCSER